MQQKFDSKWRSYRWIDEILDIIITYIHILSGNVATVHRMMLSCILELLALTFVRFCMYHANARQPETWDVGEEWDHQTTCSLKPYSSKKTFPELDSNCYRILLTIWIYLLQLKEYALLCIIMRTKRSFTLLSERLKRVARSYTFRPHMTYTFVSNPPHYIWRSSMNLRKNEHIYTPLLSPTPKSRPNPRSWTSKMGA